MTVIKHIDRYILMNFFKTFSITFFGSIFVLVMQFMFRYVDDMVGKGVGAGVLAEFFLYAALSIVPLALPLSILLGSLMTFGNLGERLELLAMKAAGISLFKIMRSLIVVMVFISIGSYYFSDYVLPKTQVRMWTLLFSIREKSPELDIPEGAFYSGITGRNIYVSDKSNNMLKDVVIYDYSNGFKNTSIILADTGFISLTQDKKALYLQLHSGETFENLNDAYKEKQEITPYRRETFAKKNIIIDFDANFTEMNNDFLKGQYVAKNTAELAIAREKEYFKSDSVHARGEAKLTLLNFYDQYHPGVDESVPRFLEDKALLSQDYNLYDYYLRSTNWTKNDIVSKAIDRMNYIINDRAYYSGTSEWLDSEARKYDIEWHKRFTLSFACIIFLFIGAPLGAIIRKGGMGMPIVLSTILFIAYYIIDNTGYKMAREGIWEVWEGMWFSAAILLPLGLTLTIMAAKDSTIMNGESYLMAFKKFFSKENRIFALGKKKQNTK